MTWLILVAAVFVLGGAWFIAKSMATRIGVLVVGLIAAGAYFALGRPDLGDRPLDGRLAEILQRERDDPESVLPRERIAVAQKQAQDNPTDPRPYVTIGDNYQTIAGQAQATGRVLLESGREAEAGRQAGIVQQSLTQALDAYAAALRRDGNDVDAAARLADLRFKTTLELDPITTNLYLAVFQARPDELRVGYMAGIGLWLQGRKADAEALWASIEPRIPPGGPETQMFAAMRQMFGVDAPAPDPGGNSPE